MAYTVQQLPNEPILVITFYPPLDAAADAAGAMKEIDRLLEGIEGRVYHIGDRTRVDLTLVDLIQALTAARSHFRPDKVTYIQVSDKLSEITQGTLKLDAFGDIDLILVASVEEGIRYARAQIAQNKGQPPVP